MFLPLVMYIYTLPIFLKMCVSAPQDTLWDTAGRTAVSSLYVSITTYFFYSPTPSTTTMCQKSECILHPLPSRRASQSEEDALFPICKEGEFQIEKQIRCVDQLAHSSINRVLLISIFWHLLNFFCEKDILIRMAHWFQIHHSGIIMFCTLTVSVRSWRSALSSVRPASLVRPGKSALSSSQFVKDTFAYDMNRHSVIEKTEVKILKLEK